jgi:hypothetical protein
LVLDLLLLHYTAHQFRDPRGSHIFQKSRIPSDPCHEQPGVNDGVIQALVMSSQESTMGSPTQFIRLGGIPDRVSSLLEIFWTRGLVPTERRGRGETTRAFSCRSTCAWSCFLRPSTYVPFASALGIRSNLSHT